MVARKRSAIKKQQLFCGLPLVEFWKHFFSIFFYLFNFSFLELVSFSKCAFIFEMYFHFQNVVARKRSAIKKQQLFCGLPLVEFWKHFFSIFFYLFNFSFLELVSFSKCAFIFEMYFHFQNVVARKRSAIKKQQHFCWLALVEFSKTFLFNLQHLFNVLIDLGFHVIKHKVVIL